MSERLEELKAALKGRYEIEREQLGAGGMATVYLAADVKHKRQVAVKVLRPDGPFQKRKDARVRGRAVEALPSLAILDYVRGHRMRLLRGISCLS